MEIPKEPTKVVTDQDIADALNRTLEEIQELKTSNEAEYKVLKIGIFCRNLDLNVEDLEKMHQMKVTTSQ